MKKSLSIQVMFDDSPFYDRFARVRAAGFEYVEFGDWSALDLTRVGDSLAAHRLHLASIAGARGHSLTEAGSREEFLEHLSQSIAIAKSFGCANLLIESDSDVGGVSVSEARDGPGFAGLAAVTRTLLDAAGKAARAGIVLHLKPPADAVPALEPYRRGMTIAGEAVNMVNSPALRLVCDAALMLDAAFPIDKYWRHIGYIHIGDEAAAWFHPEKAAELQTLRRLLVDSLGFDGFVGFACSGGGGAAAALERFLGF